MKSTKKTNETAFLDVLTDIVLERKRAISKHGDRPDRADGVTGVLIPAMDSIRTLTSIRTEDGNETWTDILAEEFLEAITEPDEDKREVELIQVACVAARWVYAIRERRRKP